MIAPDISNYGGPLPAATVQKWRENGAGRAIVGVAPNIGPAHQQMQVISSGGLGLHAYSFQYWGVAPEGLLGAVKQAAAGLPLQKVWVDFEDGDAPLEGYSTQEVVCAWIQHCLDVADSIFGRQNVGIYSAPWWWNPWTGGTTRFSDRDLWPAQPDGQANLEFQPFGGWARCTMKQYTSTTEFCGYSVDMNYYEEDEVGQYDEIIAAINKKIAQDDFRRHVAGEILSGDSALADKAYWELQYVRLLAGQPIVQGK